MGARSVVARAPSQKRTSIYAMDSTVGNGDDIARAEDLEEPGGRAQRFRRSLQLLDAPVDTTRAESNMRRWGSQCGFVSCPHRTKSNQTPPEYMRQFSGGRLGPRSRFTVRRPRRQ